MNVGHGQGWTRRAALAAIMLGGAGCAVPAPRFPLPSAPIALSRVHETQQCGAGIHASAKIDHFGKRGRIRGELLAFAMWPDRIRMDVVSPFGVTLATLTSNGSSFALSDLRSKEFFFGPSEACNIARLTSVPLPAHVLVSLMRGDAPVLKHDPGRTEMTWSSRGYYVIRLRGEHGNEERLHIAPHPDDRSRPWQEQRLRLLDVEVLQQGIVLYHAELAGHRPAAMSRAIVDPDGIDAPIAPSGPACSAELPRTIRVEVPANEQDVVFRYDNVSWNPALPDGDKTFAQPVPPGMSATYVTCDRP